MNTTKASPQNTNRKSAAVVGVLYIIGTVAGILSLVFSGSILGGGDYLAQIAAHENQMIIGALFVLTMGLALAAIPAVVFPVLRKQHERLAVGYVIFRGALETFTYIAMAAAWLVLIVLSQEYVKAGAPTGSYFQSMGSLVLGAHDAFRSVLEIVFPLGALMFYTALFRSQLIPRWISGWGLVAAAIWLGVGVLGVFGLIDPTSTLGGILSVPIGVQEMVMAVWLIVKGFNPSAIAFPAVDRATNELLSAA
jgi:hypothetical protein